jgi:hypothetical protein
MSEYLVLIYDNETAMESAGEAAFNTMMTGHATFGEKNGAALRGGNALQPTMSATSLRRDAAGELLVSDGPFVETKEALGGYYVIEAADLDEAIAIAGQLPSIDGGVEIRPIRVFD